MSSFTMSTAASFFGLKEGFLPLFEGSQGAPSLSATSSATFRWSLRGRLRALLATVSMSGALVLTGDQGLRLFGRCLLRASLSASLVRRSRTAL